MKEIENIYSLIKELEIRIKTIEEINCKDNLNILMEKLDDIESFLIRRTRGFYLRDKNR
ncbi:MAG: hypothetical protein GX987_04630 [Tissierellia bacterium]|nr:hypothetical protein [Tissierellia bacterium]